MTDAILSTLHFAPVDTAGLVASSTPRRAAVVRAAFARRPLDTATRRDPHRAVTLARVVRSSWGLGWDFELRDRESFLAVAEALADADRSTLAGDLRTLRIGAPKAPRKYRFEGRGADGLAVTLENASAKEVQLEITRRGLGIVSTAWEGWSLTSGESADDPDAVDGSAVATAVTISAAFAGRTWPVFAVALRFQRDIEPAGFDLDGDATAWAGSLAVDCVGKVLCDIDVGALAGAMIGQLEGEAFTLSADMDGWTLEIEFPNVRASVAERVAVSRDIVRHTVEFYAEANEDQNTAIIRVDG